jgi:hypothetical protein
MTLRLPPGALTRLHIHPRVRLTANRVAYRVADLDGWLAARVEGGRNAA